MSPGEAALLFLAGSGAGLINSVAGGGGFIAFPALLFHGVPPITANATQTVALWPGVLASSGAYRRELQKNRHLVGPLVVSSLVGGLVGGLLLLVTPEARFMALIPWLLLGATLLFTFGGAVTERLRRSHMNDPAQSRKAFWAGTLFQFFAAIYGGYFGAGNGFVMLAMLAVLNVGDIHSMNALKTVMGVALNAMAIITFIVAGAVAWPQALAMMTGAALGGYVGAWYAQRIEPARVRYVVIALGTAMTIYFFLRQP